MDAFEKIIGYSALKEELRQIADVLRNGKSYQRLGVLAAGGIVLIGEPGVGKTLMATCLVEASGRETFLCRKNQPGEEFVKEIKRTFERAAKNAPSVVFFDDMDKFANGDPMHRNAEEYVAIQAGIDENKENDVFVVATANETASLPSSLLRAGRLRSIVVKPPCGEDARQIIAHYISGKRFEPGADIDLIARMMAGRSCAELEAILSEAGLFAGYEGAETITMRHFLQACLKKQFSVPAEVFTEGFFPQEAKNAEAEERKGEVVAYHEAGHAVISELVAPQSVTLVCAWQNGENTGGFMLPYRKKGMPSVRSEEAEILCLLGGMAAVEQKYGEAELGISRDLEEAFGRTRELMLSCKGGFHLWGEESGYDCSESLRARREEHVGAELQRYYTRTKKLLAANTEFLDRVAAVLLEKGVLFYEELQDIKKSCMIRETLP